MGVVGILSVGGVGKCSKCRVGSKCRRFRWV